MATIKQHIGTKTALTVTGLSTLASGAYVVSEAYNCSTNDPTNIIVETSAATTNTPASNKQLLVYVKASLDGTNYQSGPESGTTATDETDLTYLGTVFMNSATTTHRKTFSLLQALGYVPPYFKLVFKNELGVALTSASVSVSEQTHEIV